jgi:hypothetical protein
MQGRLVDDSNPLNIRRQLAALTKIRYPSRRETPNSVVNQFSDPEGAGCQVEYRALVGHTRTTRHSVYPIHGLFRWVEVTLVVHDTVWWHAPSCCHQTRPPPLSRVTCHRRNRYEEPGARRGGQPRLARFSFVSYLTRSERGRLSVR